MIRFCGRNDGPYSITGSVDADVGLHGTIPMPSIQKFLDLNLVSSAKKGAYTLHRLLGLDRNFKAVSVGDKSDMWLQLKVERSVLSCSS